MLMKLPVPSFLSFKLSDSDGNLFVVSGPQINPRLSHHSYQALHVWMSFSSELNHGMWIHDLTPGNKGLSTLSHLALLITRQVSGAHVTVHISSLATRREGG